MGRSTNRTLADQLTTAAFEGSIDGVLPFRPFSNKILHLTKDFIYRGLGTRIIEKYKAAAESQFSKI